MQNGDIDGTFDLAISDVDQWQTLGNVDVVTAPSLGMFSLTLDQSSPPFDDIHVRKAVAYAIDREGLVQALLKGVVLAYHGLTFAASISRKSVFDAEEMEEAAKVAAGAP